MARKSGLGKGLDALLPALGDNEPAEHGEDAATPASIPVERLFRGAHQPRSRISEEGIEELARSIRAQGLLEPVIVRPRRAGGYELVAGERRWRAAQRAGLAAVPALVRDVDDRQAMAIALIENVQREDLNPLEQARAFKRLLDEYAFTHEELGDAVGKSRTAVSNLLRLLNLAPGAGELLESGALEMGHARALLPLGAGEQEDAARSVVARGLSVRQTEALVKQLLRGAPPPAPAGDPDTRRLERGLGERLGAPVSITANKGGKGRIVIRYSSLDELDGILTRLGASPDR